MITRVHVSLQEAKQPFNFNRIVNKNIGLCKAPGDGVDILLKDGEVNSEDYDDRLLCHIELNAANIYIALHTIKNFWSNLVLKIIKYRIISYL